METPTDRNTVLSYKEDLETLSDLASYIKYGDTGTALRIIEEWSNTLSTDLIALEDEMALFEEDSTAYYMRNISKTIEGIINHP